MSFNLGCVSIASSVDFVVVSSECRGWLCIVWFVVLSCCVYVFGPRLDLTYTCVGFVLQISSSSSPHNHATGRALLGSQRVQKWRLYIKQSSSVQRKYIVLLPPYLHRGRIVCTGQGINHLVLEANILVR